MKLKGLGTRNSDYHSGAKTWPMKGTGRVGLIYSIALVLRQTCGVYPGLTVLIWRSDFRIQTDLNRCQCVGPNIWGRNKHFPLLKLRGILFATRRDSF